MVPASPNSEDIFCRGPQAASPTTEVNEEGMVFDTGNVIAHWNRTTATVCMQARAVKADLLARMGLLP